MPLRKTCIQNYVLLYTKPFSKNQRSLIRQNKYCSITTQFLGKANDTVKDEKNILEEIARKRI